MQQRVNNNVDYEMLQRQEKARKQQMYKDILNYQCQLNKKLKPQGGMTEMEKQLNKKQLSGYKHMSPADFSMVPGLNSSTQLSYYRSPGSKMNPNMSTPNIISLESGIDPIMQLPSRNSVNSSLSVLVKDKHVRGLSQEKPYNRPFINEYRDNIPITNQRNGTKDAIRNFKARSRAGEILQSTAGEVMRSSINHSPTGSPKIY